MIYARIFSVLCVFSMLSLSCETCSDCTKYKRSFKHALSRKRRFILFPPNAAILVTPSLIKGILSKYPRGYVISYEIDMYHSLPTSLADYKPKIFEHKKTTPQPVKIEKPIESFHDFPSIPLQHPDFIDHSFHGPPSFHGEYENFSDFPPWSISHRSDIESIYPSKSNFTTSEWAVSESPQSNFWERHPIYRNRNSLIDFSENEGPNDIQIDDRIRRGVKGENITPSHKERRSIFDSLENVGRAFGVDVRSCILRTICEAKLYLLPPGKSLIQDLIRILFMIPDTQDTQEVSDEYAATGRMPASKDCKTIYEKKCPISFLALALHREIL